MSTARARILRKKAPTAEALLWGALRAHRFMGLKFRRQYPIGRYIVDFACLDRKLVVEVDGPTHSPSADAVRTSVIEGNGFQVVRLRNEEVFADLDGVLRRLAHLMACSGEPVPPLPPKPAAWAPPSPHGGGGSGATLRGTPSTGPGRATKQEEGSAP